MPANRQNHNQESMGKQKIHLQYVLSSASGAVVWNAISTAAGLQTWFADRVEIDRRHCTFCWGKTEVREADIVSLSSRRCVRFRWTDEDPGTYFELRISQSELTNDLLLEITDFADKDEEDDQRDLWNMQIEALRRAYGV